MRKLDRSNMRIIIWGIISMALLLLWGVFDLEFGWVIAGVTIGILTYLHYRAVRKKK